MSTCQCLPPLSSFLSFSCPFFLTNKTKQIPLKRARWTSSLACRCNRHRDEIEKKEKAGTWQHLRPSYSFFGGNFVRNVGIFSSHSFRVSETREYLGFVFSYWILRYESRTGSGRPMNSFFWRELRRKLYNLCASFSVGLKDPWEMDTRVQGTLDSCRVQETRMLLPFIAI